MPHGAQFENQGMGCKTYFWPKSKDTHVFFFTRDDEPLGEYRAETLSSGRFLIIEEMYLTRSSFLSEYPNDLSFIRKTATLDWDGSLWVGSTIHWEHIVRSRDGSIIKRLNDSVVKTSRAAVTIIVPAEMMENNKEYYISAYAIPVSIYEAEFCLGVEKGKGRRLKWNKVVDGKSNMHLELPVSYPMLLLELHEKIPSPPHDAIPMFARTKIISSMTHEAGLYEGETITFKPD